jgi:hypothetical protein
LNPLRKLDPPHGASILRSDDAGNCSGIAILAVDTRVWLTQVDFIEEVEEVGAELQVKRFTDGDRLCHRQVGVDIARTKNRIATDVAKSSNE